MPKIPKSVRVKWPVGPHYVRWVDGNGINAWARFKIKSADWYLDTLVIVGREAGNLDRYAGIEMALDGVLSSLCAAVDAAGWGLLDAFTRSVKTSETGRGAVVTKGWESVFGLARAMRITLPSEVAVSKALAGMDSDAPEGWYAQLLQLRERAVQHNVLVRRFNVGDKSGRFVDVPGLGPCRPIKYLKQVRKDANKLVKVLLADIDALPKLLAPKSKAKRKNHPGRRPLPDLMARAHVVYPLDLGVAAEPPGVD